MSVKLNVLILEVLSVKVEGENCQQELHKCCDIKIKLAYRLEKNLLLIPYIGKEKNSHAFNTRHTF
jgi:hypothetical protein